jgi:hypothetical protein
MSWGPPNEPRARAIEHRSRLAVSSVFGPAADPLGAGYQTAHTLAQAPRLATGRILDAWAYLHGYRVALDGGLPIMAAVALAPASLDRVGPKSAGMYLPGTAVVCLVQPGSSRALILGALPTVGRGAGDALPDFVHQASRCGLRVDEVHNAVFQTRGSGGVAAWGAGRPFDGTAGMEQGWITATGLRVLVDEDMVQLAVDEATGVFAFHADQLLRICGVNFQEFSGGHEREILIDGGEVALYEGVATYPWEQYGVHTPDEDPLRDIAPESWQGNDAHYAAREPRHDDQRPFHRAFRLGGYLGQGGARYVVAPPRSTDPMRHGERPDGMTGLFAERVALSGRYTLESAQGIVLAKRMRIAAPIRRARPESPDGDTADTYRPGGRGTQGDPHTVVSAPAGDGSATQQAAAALDAFAYTTAYEGILPVLRHAQDWTLTAEGDGLVPQFTQLRDAAAIDPPDPIQIHIDHRYGDIATWCNTSVIHMADAGAVITADAFGGEFRMVGGSLFLSAPGDIVLSAGRNIVGLAGRNLALRAVDGIDVASAQGDVRLKAERDLQALAGNSGSGALLLEARSASVYDYEGKVGTGIRAGGIQIKSAGEIASWARGHYIRALEGRAVTIDSGDGQVLVRGAGMTRFLSGAAADYFGGDTDEVDAANVFSASGTYLQGSLAVAGAASVNGGLLVDGHVSVLNGHIGTELSDEFSGMVGALKDESLRANREAMDANIAGTRRAREQGGEARELVARAYDDAGRPGHAGTIAAVAASFRTTRQCGGEAFEIWEARWQQLARLSGQGVGRWREPAVSAAGQTTRPFPGDEAWSGQSFVEQDLTLWDAAVDRPKSADDEAYADPQLADPVRGPFEDRFPILDP